MLELCFHNLCLYRFSFSSPLNSCYVGQIVDLFATTNVPGIAGPLLVRKISLSLSS